MEDETTKYDVRMTRRLREIIEEMADEQSTDSRRVMPADVVRDAIVFYARANGKAVKPEDARIERGGYRRQQRGKKPA